jgi:N-acetylglucosaminyldiphosphoundecaprenol N-acetyl-beta-D-mannosaminyltransferase
MDDMIAKYELFGVNISPVTYEKAVEFIISSAQQRVGAIITHLPVHGLVLASRDAILREKINSFDIVAPDGQPVRWALNFLYGTGLSDRVYGPEFMMRLCQKAASLGIGVYLYGSYPHVVESLRANLLKRFPDLKVVGYESPPFRPLTPEEDQAAVDRINSSGAGIVFLGLGCPLQDMFAYEHREKINAAQVCVGAAFDLHAENKKMAPRWMQERGLEWLYRLVQDPRRLWWRYLSTNSMFLLLLLKVCLKNRSRLKLPRI